MDRYHMVNGELIKYTAEELESLEGTPTPEASLSLEERVALLEAERAADIAAYEEGVNNG